MMNYSGKIEKSKSGIDKWRRNMDGKEWRRLNQITNDKLSLEDKV